MNLGFPLPQGLDTPIKTCVEELVKLRKQYKKLMVEEPDVE